MRRRRGMRNARNVSEYLKSVPPRPRKALNELRRTIKAIVPNASEVISYGIPTFKDGRMLVAYAAFKDHCSFFPLGSKVLDEFQEELAPYRKSKGTIYFSAERPLPRILVQKIVRARVRQNRARDRAASSQKRIR